MLSENKEKKELLKGKDNFPGKKGFILNKPQLCRLFLLLLH